MQFHTKRPLYLFAIAGFLILGTMTAVSPASTPEGRHGARPSIQECVPPILHYAQPAIDWMQALPVGNGRLGAMVFGGAATEQIALNESSVWSGPGEDKADEYNRAGAHKFLPEIRRKIFSGDYKDAQALINREVLGARPPGSYQPLGDLRLDFTLPASAEISAYRRELNLDEATARVTFRASGITHTREIFSSAPQQAIIVRLACDAPGELSFSAKLDRVECATGTTVGENCYELHGRADQGKPTAGTSFVARLKIITEGGTVRAEAGRLRVTGANAATLIITAATDYQNAGDIATPRSRAITQGDTAAALPYPRLRAAHIADYQKLFRRVSLTLGGKGGASKSAASANSLPTDRRLADARASSGPCDPALAELYFHYGRYLLISSSRPGGLPANLQGIWNHMTAPPWFCGWHFDINAQMNYWHANVTALDECHAPFLDLIDRLRVNGRKTARDVYNCRGFVVSHRTNAGLFTSPVNGLGLWPVGAGWLAQHYWTHYEFTRDETFLRDRAYPAIREAAEFFLDWLVPNPRTGLLVSGPSLSPENSHAIPNGSSTTTLDMGPAMDQQIAAEVFDNCLAAARILGIRDAFTTEVATARKRLAPTQIGSDGRLLEWSAEFAEREPGHRHVSHLYAVYPGLAISPRATPELAAAARKSLAARIAGAADLKRSVNISDNSNVGWSLAWNTSLWARLGEAERARDAIDGLLRRCTSPNLLDTHPQKNAPHGVFQIDGNFGGAAGIAEMLLQSHADEIALLPALPDAWSEGNFSGLRARGGYTIAAAWRGGKLIDATITAAHSGSCAIRAPSAFALFDGGKLIAQSRPAPGAGTTHTVRFDAIAGKTYRLQSIDK